MNALMMIADVETVHPRLSFAAGPLADSRKLLPNNHFESTIGALA
ncbi:hypothetical protein [Nocardia elegans]|nr:hypothetical protein [Nocardia elegans]